MMNLREIASACQAHVETDSLGTDMALGVSTDSRTIRAGELFIALCGDKFDGHQYLSQVQERGALAAIVSQQWLLTQADQAPVLSLPLLPVHDTRLALGSLAAHWRQKFSLPLIGVTGSNGKTSVKEMCAAILRHHFATETASGQSSVLATQGNLNNDIGLPQMLLRLRPEHRCAVLEMGMDHPGEIVYLTCLTRPTVVVINNAQRAHLAGLGSLEEVARAKAEILAGLAPDGTAIFNADDTYAPLWRDMASGKHIVSFGLNPGATVSATNISEADMQAAAPVTRFTLLTPLGDCIVSLSVAGRHNVRNALAAAAATMAVGVPLASIAEALGAFSGVAGRLQLRTGRQGSRLIDDSYNANPDSMRAALDVLAACPGKKLFVMGDMGETGAFAEQVHHEIGRYAKSQGVDQLFALGRLTALAVSAFGAQGQHFDSLEELLAGLAAELGPGATVLIKGSRFMRMERVASALQEECNAA